MNRHTKSNGSTRPVATLGPARSWAAMGLAAALLLSLTTLSPQQSASATSAPAQGTPTWVAPATLYEVNVRQFSDTHNFDGVTAALNRLNTLGVKVLWLMPIYPIGVPNRKGSLGSPYSVSDYKGINNEFGDATSLHRLINTAHGLGMHVILDWVANHTSWDNPWTVHKDWYQLDGGGNFQPPTGTDWTDVIQLNYGSSAMRLAMIDSMKYWVTNFSVDGFRQDSAGMIPVDFWEQAKTELAKTGHSLFMLAEDSANLQFLYKGFSANYNWPGLQLLKNVAAGTATKYDLQSEIIGDTLNYPAGSFVLNMITNHDENSWNGTVQHFFGGKEQAFAALTFTWPGMPLLYNAQETGLNKQLAFFENDPIAWNYQSPLQAFYKKLVSLKANNRALWAGTAGGSFVPLSTGNDKVMAFTRIRGASKVFFVMNLGATKQQVTVRFGSKAQKLYNFATGKQETVAPLKSFKMNGWAFATYSSAR